MPSPQTESQTQKSDLATSEFARTDLAQSGQSATPSVETREGTSEVEVAAASSPASIAATGLVSKAPLTSASANALVAMLLKSDSTLTDWRVALERAGGLDGFERLLAQGQGARNRISGSRIGGRVVANPTLLMAAARHDDEEAVDALMALELLRRPASTSALALDARDNDGWSALHWAAAYARPSIIRKIAEAFGPERSNGADRQRWTPLMVAAIKGRPEAVEALLPVSDLAAEDADGHNALALASVYGPDALGPLLDAERALRGALLDLADERNGWLGAQEEQAERFARALLVARASDEKQSLARIGERLADIAFEFDAPDAWTVEPQAQAAEGHASEIGESSSPAVLAANETRAAQSLAAQTLDAIARLVVPDEDEEEDSTVSEFVAQLVPKRLPAALIEGLLAQLLARAQSGEDDAPSDAISESAGDVATAEIGRAHV